ncbi:hypothetical protein IPJ72_03185 [Candidatus Peregrinibacteria bacterium]|nr:MAG: hypothetical protein IPJ72_03185 [Candidatus Peregrinibacteria bacterium]
MAFKVKKIRKRPHYRAKKAPEKSKAPMPWYQVVALVVFTFGLMGLVYQAEQFGVWFKASVLQAPLPFDGTVMPVEKVPNWVTWGGDADTHYADIPPRN